jgi:hypothetical protein
VRGCALRPFPVFSLCAIEPLCHWTVRPRIAPNQSTPCWGETRSPELCGLEHNRREASRCLWFRQILAGLVFHKLFSFYVPLN